MTCIRTQVVARARARMCVCVCVCVCLCVSVCVVVVVGFYTALFSAVEQTHCARD